MAKDIFVGRKIEIDNLLNLHSTNNKNLVVIKGRRRIGKSRLVQEFAKRADTKFYNFAGLAGLNSKEQLENFAVQLSEQVLDNSDTPFKFDSWSSALSTFNKYIKDNDIVLFDEISWMCANDNTFIPKLKNWWDNLNTSITFVFCGSVSTWIEANILNSTAFFGRVNLTIALEPLNITESYSLLKTRGFKASNYDMFKLLSILGGIPWYLEQVLPNLNADENIRQLCFSKNGLLVNEFDRIFNDLFNGRSAIYKKILKALEDGAKSLSEIRELINYANSGTLSELIENLITSKFITKQELWSFKTGKTLKKSTYRICDPYIRFYLKLIEPNLKKINANNLEKVSLIDITGFNSHLGLQIEIFLLQNKKLIQEKINILPSDIYNEGPYRQFKTTTTKGCQIDYLIQTLTHSLFICEFKFKLKEIDKEIIEQVTNKIKALKLPRGFAAIPVLLHISGVSYNVDTSGYFYRIVDITDFLVD